MIDFVMLQHDGWKKNFIPYGSQANSLTLISKVSFTNMKIVFCLNSNDGTRYVVVLKVNDEFSLVVQYDTKSFEPVFVIPLRGEYIKVEKVA